MSTQLPGQDRPIEQAQGHWLLAKMGKKVLRPGGLALTQSLLEKAQIPGKHVVEFAPGIGRTAKIILGKTPAHYTGVDLDPKAVELVRTVTIEEGFGGKSEVINASASETGLQEASADVVIGEAMLTMQGEKAKLAIAQEAYRILKPGGRYCIHELAYAPDDISEEKVEEIRKDLARTIRVNARPLTIKEWVALLEQAGFKVEAYQTAPMKLLDPTRIVADEGVKGAFTFAKNLKANPDVRERVMGMRKAFSRHKQNLAGLALVAVKN